MGQQHLKQWMLETVAHQLRQWAARLDHWRAESPASQQTTTSLPETPGSPPAHWLELVQSGGATQLLETLELESSDESSDESLAEMVLDHEAAQAEGRLSPLTTTEPKPESFNGRFEPSEQASSRRTPRFQSTSEQASSRRTPRFQSTAETPIVSPAEFRPTLFLSPPGDRHFERRSTSETPDFSDSVLTELADNGWGNDQPLAVPPERQSMFVSQRPTVGDRSDDSNRVPELHPPDSWLNPTTRVTPKPTPPATSTTVKLQFPLSHLPNRPMNSSPPRQNPGQMEPPRPHSPHPVHPTPTDQRSNLGDLKLQSWQRDRPPEASQSSPISQRRSGIDVALNSPEPRASFRPKPESPNDRTTPTFEQSRWVKSSPKVPPNVPSDQSLPQFAPERVASRAVVPSTASVTDDPWPDLPEAQPPDGSQLMHLLESRHRLAYLEQEQQGTRWNG